MSRHYHFLKCDKQRFHHDIEIILQGESGKIFRIASGKNLLPLYFGRDDLK